VLTQQPLLLIAVLIGLFDLWVNFRRLGVVEVDD